MDSPSINRTTYHPSVSGADEASEKSTLSSSNHQLDEAKRSEATNPQTKSNSTTKSVRDIAELTGGVVISIIKACPLLQAGLGLGRLGLELSNFVIGKTKDLPETSLESRETALKASTLGAFATSLTNIFMGKTESQDSKVTQYSNVVPIFGAAIDLIGSGIEHLKAALGDETSTHEGLKGRGQYDLIKKDFSKDVNYGSEEVVRTKTTAMRFSSLKEKTNHLEAKLANASTPEEQAFIQKQLANVSKEMNALNKNNPLAEKIHNLEKEIKLLEGKLEKFPEERASTENQLHAANQELETLTKNSWIGSNHSRDVLVKNDFKTSRDDIVSTAVNLREQNITVNHPDGSESTISMLRFGAIWDPKNGLTSLAELNSLDSELQECQGNPEKEKAFDHKIDARLAELDGLAEKFTSVDQQFVIQETKQKIEAFRPGGTSSLEQRNEIINDREKVLRDQTLEPITLQLKNNISKMIKDSKGENTMRMTHIGLLNPKADVDFQEGGWAHIESNQILDMEAAFKSIDNLVIKVRDEPGTFFDENLDGSVVMYVSADEIEWAGEIPSEIKLETCFMNLSVQGHTTNDGIQAEHNQAEINKLEQWIATDTNLTEEDKGSLNEELAKLKDRLESKKESSFDLAADLALFVEKFSAMSEGCLSCKDRGGTVAEMIAIKLIEQTWTKEATTDQQKTVKKAIKEFNNEILDKESPCIKVINDCTGTSIAKVDYRLLKNMDTSVRVRKLGELVFAAATGGLNVTPEAAAAA